MAATRAKGKTSGPIGAVVRVRQEPRDQSGNRGRQCATARIARPS